MKKHIQRKFKENPAIVSSTVTVILVMTLVVLKGIAVWVSGSAAVLSALIDSLSDIGLSLMTLVSVRWSLKPADDNHRHGHGKVEGIAALIQAMMLVGGSAFLVLEAFDRFAHPVQMTDHPLTLGLMLASTLLSVGIAYVQKMGARHSDSLAVEADSLHYSADVIINGSVALVVLADYLGLFGSWLDPVSAIGVAVIMAKTAYEVTLKAFGMLLDEELPEDTRNLITAKIKSHPQVIGLHDLRTSKSGTTCFISFDLELPPEMTLEAAHNVARDVENALLLDYPKSEIMIHLDPAGDLRDSRHQHIK